MNNIHLERVVAQHLPGLTLGEAFPVEPGSIMERYGYRVFPIMPAPQDRSHNAVVYEIEPDGSVESTHILNDLTINLTALAGQGEASGTGYWRMPRQPASALPCQDSAQRQRRTPARYRPFGQGCLPD